MPPVYIGDRSLRPKVSLTKHISNGWRSLNKPREIYLGLSRGMKVLFLLMIIVTGVLIADQAFKPTGGHSGSSPLGDPDIVTPLWVANAAASDNSEYATSGRVVYNAGAVWANSKGLVLQPRAGGASDYAVAVSKTGFDPGPVSGKHFRFTFFWKVSAITSWPNGARFFMYLTRNGTVPTTSGYTPYTDPSVALIVSTEPQAGPTYNNYLFLQKNPSESISTEDTGACATVSSCYLSEPYGNLAPATFVIQSSLWLNYTGTSTAAANGCAGAGTMPAGGNGCSSLLVEQAATVTGSSWSSTQGIPPFQIQGQKYYVGFYAPGTANADFLIAYNAANANMPQFISPDAAGGTPPASMQAGIAQILSTPVTISPTVDTGGLFGPILNALGSALVIALGVIAKFFGYVYNSFIAALDVVGNFLGLGAVGSAFAGALSAFSNWISLVFGNIFAQAANMIGFIGNSILLLTAGIANYWDGAAAFLGQMVDIWNGGWSFVTVVMRFNLLGIKWAVVVFLVWGIMASAGSFPEGFMTWFNVGIIFTVKIFQAVYWIADQAFTTILKTKQTIADWT
jgi:hypothetical protein